jgi:peptidoglycan/xylan/chitin deacetylase (PgdA/CDA1 family)
MSPVPVSTAPVSPAPVSTVPVLMYHEISGTSATQSKLAVAPGVFARQLDYLNEAGYTALTAGELAAILAGGAARLPERPVVLTFDDGYGDFHSAALPLLKQHDLAGTLFMTTGFVEAPGAPTRMLNWRELGEIRDQGIEIGAHTCLHPQLDQLAGPRLREELYVSKSTLEDKLGITVPGLAYPYGYSNARVRQVARELDYGYGYAVANAVTTSAADNFALPRLTVRRSTTMDDFRRMVSGQDTPALRRDRVLTRGYTVVRRARSLIRSAQEVSARYHR